MLEQFADRLARAVGNRRNPVLVGLDPRFESLPAVFSRNIEARNHGGVAAAYEAFCRAIIDAVAPLVPAVKPQAAFFEELGPPGMAALAAVICYARERGLIVILDGKRNDIGTTAAAYARAYLGDASAWGADALTVSPYLGDDSLTPFVETCTARAAGIFVLVKTSNPGGGLFQDLPAGGKPVYRHVAERVESLAQGSAGACGYGAVGAVAGGTYPEQLAELRSAMPHAWILVPGYGAQGAQAKDVAGAFDARGLGAIVNNSRGIIFAHASERYGARFGETNWQMAVEAATRDMIDQLRAETNAARLSGPL